MNYTQKIVSCAFIGLLLFVSGCAKKSNYKPHSLPSLKESVHVDYQETKEQVTVRAKKFTHNDCDTFFGDRASKILSGKRPLQPIQLCIENSSKVAVLLFDENINLRLVPTQMVAGRLTPYRFATSAIWSGVGLFGLSVITLPWLFPAAFPLFCHILGAFGTILSVNGAVFFFLSAPLILVATPFIFIADNALFRSCPKELKNCIHKTEKGKAVVIHPDGIIDMLIFVHCDQFKPTFDVTLLNENDQTKKQTFTVHLPAQDITAPNNAKHTDFQGA